MVQLTFDFVGQLDVDQIEIDRQTRIEEVKHLWKICWDWDGPEVGEPLEVGYPCVEELESGEKYYYYHAPCIAEKEIEPDVWIVRIEYHEDAPKHCKEQNGIKLKLSAEEIWAPVGILSRKRKSDE